MSVKRYKMEPTEYSLPEGTKDITYIEETLLLNQLNVAYTKCMNGIRRCNGMYRNFSCWTSCIENIVDILQKYKDEGSKFPEACALYDVAKGYLDDIYKLYDNYD
jgi:hypothetical protein